MRTVFLVGWYGLGLEAGRARFLILSQIVVWQAVVGGEVY